MFISEAFASAWVLALVWSLWFPTRLVPGQGRLSPEVTTPTPFCRETPRGHCSVVTNPYDTPRGEFLHLCSSYMSILLWSMVIYSRRSSWAVFTWICLSIPWSSMRISCLASSDRFRWAPTHLWMSNSIWNGRTVITIVVLYMYDEPAIILFSRTSNCLSTFFRNVQFFWTLDLY